MQNFLRHLFSTDFLPHGACLRWQTDVLLLHVISDSAIALAYFCIPAMLYYFVRRRSDISFHWIYLAFSLFIVFCGLTHTMDVVTLYEPLYRFAGVLKLFTAIASVGTAILLARMMPVFLTLPSVRQLEESNARLTLEIGERRKAEGRLAAASEILESALNSSQVAAWRWKTEEGVAEWSGPVDRVFGVSPILLKRVKAAHALVHPDDLGRLNTCLDDAIETESSFEVEYRILRPDGAQRWIAERGGATRNHREVAGVSFDVTEKKQLAEALARSEIEFRQLANSMPQIVSAANADGTVYFLNDRFHEVTGLQLNAVPTLHDRRQVLHPEDRRRWEACLNEALVKGQGYEIEYRYWDREKQEYRWYLGRGCPIKDTQGIVQRWFVTSTDIHDRKTIETKLRESEQALLERDRQLKLLFETGSIGDWSIDIVKDEVTGHPSFWKMYGERRMVNHTPSSWVRDRWHPDDVTTIEENVRALIRDDVPLSSEFRIIWPDGSLHWVSCRGIATRNEAGQAIRTSGLLIDITERKREEDKFRTAVEASPSAMLLVTAAGKITFANSRTEKIFGYEETDLRGEPITKLFVNGLDALKAARGITSPIEAQGLTKSGVQIPIELAVASSQLQDGVELVSIIDMTERRQAHEISQMLEIMVAGVMEYAIFMLNRDGRILTWNDGAERLEGYRAEEIVGRHFSIFSQPSEIDSGQPNLALGVALAEGKFAREGWRIRRDGSKYLASITITPVQDIHGLCYGFCHVTHDITEQRAAEEALRKSEREFRLLADTMPQIVWTTDAAGYPSYFNKRWYEQSGLDQSILQHRTPRRDWLRRILHPDQLDAVVDTWREAMESGSRFEIEYRHWDQHRGYRWHLARALPITDEEGKITRWFGTATDIHDQKTANARLEAEVQMRTADLSSSVEQLKRSEETLLTSLHEKSVLLQEVHHRVRNNLQIICSLLSMQISLLDDPAAIAQLRESERRVRSMSLVHDQLDNHAEKTAIDLPEFIRSLISTLLDSFENPKSLTWRLNLTPVSLTIEQAIPAGLILNELLSNALLYAYPGGGGGEIALDLSAESGFVRISVRDHGIGLPPNLGPDGGAMLGLNVVQILTKQLCGELQMNSKDGVAVNILFPLTDESRK